MAQLNKEMLRTSNSYYYVTVTRHHKELILMQYIGISRHYYAHSLTHA